MPAFPTDIIVDSVNRIYQKSSRGVKISSEEESFLIDAESVLGIALNQITFIQNKLKDQEANRWYHERLC